MSKKIEDYLHLYLGCDVMILGKVKTVTVIQSIAPFVVTINKGDSRKGVWRNMKEIKPILRPLSDMTEEEAREYASFYMNYIGDGIPVRVGIDNDNVKINVGDENHGAVLWPLGQHGQKPESLRYLLSKHFDLFGLIEEGLAIDKTKSTNQIERG